MHLTEDAGARRDFIVYGNRMKDTNWEAKVIRTPDAGSNENPYQFYEEIPEAEEDESDGFGD
jgi:hypothetical protein